MEIYVRDSYDQGRLMGLCGWTSSRHPWIYLYMKFLSLTVVMMATDIDLSSRCPSLIATCTIFIANYTREAARCQGPVQAIDPGQRGGGLLLIISSSPSWVRWAQEKAPSYVE